MLLILQDHTQQWVRAPCFTLSKVGSCPVKRSNFVTSIWDLNHSVLASARNCTHSSFEPEAYDLSALEKSTYRSLRVHEQDQVDLSIQKNNRKISTFDGASDDPDDVPFLTTRQPSNSMTPRPHFIQKSQVQSPSDEELRSQQASEGQDRAFLNPFGEGIDSSRRTSASSDASIYLRPNAFPGHRDTLARLPQLTFEHNHPENIFPLTDSSDTIRQPSWVSSSFTVDPALPRSGILPPSIVSKVLRLLSSENYKALRLVCRLWNSILPFPKLPVVLRLPREILQQIYSYLLPSGFDAARHTCREWYLASLNRTVQDQIARVSFCQLALNADIQLRRNLVSRRSSSSSSSLSELENGGHSINREWIYSKRLATESRISPGWRGGPPLTNKNELFSRLAVTEEVEFSQILHGEYVGRSRFTVSTCGKFVLVVSSEEITLYDLYAPGGSVFPVTRLVAGSEVLKVSMDTSSERYSVAALLSGRVGVLWDLAGTPSKMRYCKGPGETIALGMQTVIQDSATGVYTQPAMPNLRDHSEESVVSETRRGPARVLSTPGVKTGPGFIPSPPSS
ncbi:hypothetical protein RBB50_002856 [Rhinocladiella similis]